jgi:hypothetical protein
MLALVVTRGALENLFVIDTCGPGGRQSVEIGPREPSRHQNCGVSAGELTTTTRSLRVTAHCRNGRPLCLQPRRRA